MEPVSPGNVPPPPADASPRPPAWLAGLARSKVSATLFVAALAAFALCWHDGGTSSLRAPFPPGVCQRYGALSAQAVREGELWRFVTTLVVSRWGLDLLIFLFLLWDLGPSLERLLGSLRFAGVYLGAGVAGVAVGAIAAPLATMPGTMVGLYAMLGAVPGAIYAAHGASLRRTAADPQVRSSLMWVGLWLAIGYFGGPGWNLVGMAAAALAGCLLAAGLGCLPERLVLGLALVSAPAVAALGGAGLVHQGFRWHDGGLTVLRPARDRTGNAPDGELPPAEAAANAAAKLRTRFEHLLEPYGPLPTGEGVDDEAYATIGRVLDRLDAAIADPDSQVTTEVDDLRLRCLLLLGRKVQALALARDFVAPDPAARALIGVTFSVQGQSRLSEAIDHLEGALTRDASLDRRIPEVQFHLADCLDRRGVPEDATPHYRAYLERVGDGPYPAFRRPLVESARRRLELR